MLLLRGTLYVPTSKHLSCLCVPAPLDLEWWQPGGRLLHADPVEHSAHLLGRQHGRRQVHDLEAARGILPQSFLNTLTNCVHATVWLATLLD